MKQLTHVMAQVISGIFYHDFDEICWPQSIRSLKLGHVTAKGSMSLTWVGRVFGLRKLYFTKVSKTLDNVAVYLIKSLKSVSEWKKITNKNKNSWICFLSTFQKVFLSGIAEFVRWWIFERFHCQVLTNFCHQYHDDKYQVKHWCVYSDAIEHLEINCIFKIPSYQNILITFDPFPNNN